MSNSELGFNMIHFEAGEIIFTKGDKGQEAYMIMGGAVEIYSVSDASKTISPV